MSSHEFQLTKEIELDAPVEDVWEAIATGPGINSWFIGHSEVEPGEGGVVKFTLGDFSTAGSVTQWDPPKRFAYRGADMPDGSFAAFDYVIEGRAGGKSLLRMVQSASADESSWEAEYNALDKGWELYLHTLSQCLEHFRGETATSVCLDVQAGEENKAWATLTSALGIPADISEGDQVRFSVPGVPPVEGVVDYVAAPNVLGVRTGDGLLRFTGQFGSMGVGHHLFAADVDQKKAEESWQSWLTGLYS
jgi:uncharacterized protein YndB with AHSA1/START domain